MILEGENLFKLIEKLWALQEPKEADENTIENYLEFN